MSAQASPTDVLLEMRGVVKTYPGARALDRVDFELRRGEVHALVGENGAGKSTLMHVLAGVTAPDEGTILLDGAPVRFPEPQSASQHGIAVVFQELSLADDLSIAENVFANRQPAGAGGLIDWPELFVRTREMLALFEWDTDPRTPVRDLGAAQRQVVEVLKALSQHPRVLVLDEPTSSLTAVETRLLFANIRRLKAEGVACIYISHHLPEVFEVADRVTVLRDGRHVDTCPVDQVAEQDLVRKMVGREIADMYGRGAGAAEEVRFRLRGGGRAGAFHSIDLEVRRGEILGLAGLAGAGRTELGRAIFGAEPLDGGAMTLDGRPYRACAPSEAIRSGVAYLTESRKEDGLFLDMPIRANCVATSLSTVAAGFGLMNESAITERAEECRRDFGITASGVWQEVGTLSGGNQQKVLLAMWVGTRPALLIADEPTRGVDVGARSGIYRILRRLAGEGMAILLISSDLPELLGLTDRVLVMRGGRMAGEFVTRDASEEQIIACAAGVGAER